MAMSFSYTEKGQGLNLPDNYLPTAFAFRGEPDSAAFYPLIPVPVRDAKGADRLPFSVSAADLHNPTALTSAIASKHDTGAFYIGPRRTSDAPISPRSVIPTPGHGIVPTSVVGIIDIGIAFWNERFCRRGTDGTLKSRFAGFGYLDFDHDGNGAPLVTRITKIDDLIAGTQLPGGERALLSALGKAHKGSVHASHPKAGRLYRPDGLNHGTAITDLAAGAPPEAAGGAPVLFGIDLPVEALLDASGETLQITLNVALRELLDDVAIWAEANEKSPALTVVLSFAFPGGPADGSHPVVAHLSELLTTHPLANHNVTFVVPTGNHLQDRLHAKLENIPVKETSMPLRWFLHPDDHAPNTVEIVMDAPGDFTLNLTHPDGRTVAVPVALDTYGELGDQGRPIGAVWARALGNSQIKLRISLGATSHAAAPMPVSAPGEWQLSLTAGNKPLSNVALWILRKDDLGVTRRLPPARQSHFRDPAYRHRDALGRFPIDDASSPHSAVRRKGSASLLAAGGVPKIVPVGAEQQTWAIKTSRTPAWYSGQLSGQAKPEYRLVDLGGPGRGTEAVGNGSPQRFRVSGSSVAAALRAR
jgi:hypothetical protein